MVQREVHTYCYFRETPYNLQLQRNTTRFTEDLNDKIQ